MYFIKLFAWVADRARAVEPRELAFSFKDSILSWPSFKVVFFFALRKLRKKCDLLSRSFMNGYSFPSFPSRSKFSYALRNFKTDSLFYSEVYRQYYAYYVEKLKFHTYTDEEFISFKAIFVHLYKIYLPSFLVLCGRFLEFVLISFVGWVLRVVFFLLKVIFSISIYCGINFLLVFRFFFIVWGEVNFRVFKGLYELILFLCRIALFSLKFIINIFKRFIYRVSFILKTFYGIVLWLFQFLVSKDSAFYLKLVLFFRYDFIARNEYLVVKFIFLLFYFFSFLFWFVSFVLLRFLFFFYFFFVFIYLVLRLKINDFFIVFKIFCDFLLNLYIIIKYDW